MSWSDAVKERIEALKPVKPSQALSTRLVGLIDLTSLNDADTESSVAAFLEKANTDYGHVAAVCINPAFVRMAAAQFEGTAVKVATVVNFPSGDASLEDTLIEVGRALEDGAQEIDVVFPYRRYLSGDKQYAATFVAACKAACGDDVTLKVILETGALKDPAIIAEASKVALKAGANFIKTSTGKIAEGASLEAAATMLLVIKQLSDQADQSFGLKISGGVREVPQAAQYVELAEQIMGRDWVSPNTFRIGASQLLDNLLKV